MNKAQKFFERSQLINNQIWDIMVKQAIAFSEGKQLAGSFDLQELNQVITDLLNLQRDIVKTYGVPPKSLQDYFDASLRMADDIKNGTLLL